MNNSSEWLKILALPENASGFENQRDFAELTEALGVATWAFPGNLDTVDLKTPVKDILNHMEALTLKDQINFIKKFELGIGAQAQWDTVLQVAHQAGTTAGNRRATHPAATGDAPRNYKQIFNLIKTTFFCTGQRFPSITIEKELNDSIRFGLSLTSKIETTSVLMLYQLWLHWQKGFVHSFDRRVNMRFSPDSHYYWVDWS